MPTANAAYALREEFAGTVTVYDTAEDQEQGNGREVDVFQGGRVALSDGSTFDVGAKLKDGKGTIVVDGTDLFLIDVLDAYPALKRVEVPKGAKPNATLADLSTATLKQRAAAAGLKTSGSKQELVERLEAQAATTATTEEA